jgi:uncharacterized protein (DUF2252 family)
MPRQSGITAQILAENAGRDRERVALKLRLLRGDKFAFFRGTNALFLRFLPRGSPLFRAPATLVSGDLHLENFGAFKGDNRLVYFDINDFDEACVAPFTVDVVRFLSCLVVAGDSLGLGRGAVARLQAAYLSAYAQAIGDGKPRWIERSLAEGVFRKLLRRADRRTRVELLDRYTRRQDGERRVRIDGRRTLALEDGESRRLTALLAAYARHQDRGRRDFFRLRSAARRIAGNGSLGLPRYLLLVEGRGSPDGNFALDLKFAAPSAVARWLGREQPPFAGEAARVVAMQRILQAIPPALLHQLSFDAAPFVLKELQPSIDRLQLDAWRGKTRRLIEAVTGMGHVSAWAHLRGCGHFGTASVEELQRHVAGRGWRTQALAVATGASARVEEAWTLYARDFDAGRVPAAGTV